MKKNSYVGPLVVVTGLFFMWGFITSMNDILIPYLKKVFELNYFEAMLVQFSFFGAYFIGSVIYFFISAGKGDPIMKIGYKNGLIAGLLVSAFGLLLFYPAASLKMYGVFLSALFILGLGFTILQIAANPYVARLGSPETASSRLNLSQAFNSFGTTIAPVIGGYFVFHYFIKWGKPFLNAVGEPVTLNSGETISAYGVQFPYLIFALVFVLMAVIIRLSNLPVINTENEIPKGFGALKYNHLVLGMIAIFMYVGAEVSIGSILINFMDETFSIGEMQAKSFLAFYWGGAMIGRFLGAISMGEIKQVVKKYSLMLLVSITVFFVIFGVVWIESNFAFKFLSILPYTGFMLLNLIAFRVGNSLPGRTLMVFALVNIVLLIIALTNSGQIVLWSLLSIGLFNSIMWSNIFTLAIDKLGKYTSQGSSLLVMMILGGAIIPIIQGSVADAAGVHFSFIVPLIPYLYIAYYGWKGHKIVNL